MYAAKALNDPNHDQGHHGHDKDDSICRARQKSFHPFCVRPKEQTKEDRNRKHEYSVPACQCTLAHCASRSDRISCRKQAIALKTPPRSFTSCSTCPAQASAVVPILRHGKLRQLRCLHRRFDCYRVERTSSQAGVSPAEVQRLFTAHCYDNHQSSQR